MKTMLSEPSMHAASTRTLADKQAREGEHIEPNSIVLGCMHMYSELRFYTKCKSEPLESITKGRQCWLHLINVFQSWFNLHALVATAIIDLL